MIRAYREADRAAIQDIRQQAFAGSPWHERLSNEAVATWWQACIVRRGFHCLVMELGGSVVGFTCWDAPTIVDLEQGRGKALAQFIRGLDCERVIWLRETCVHPEHQGKELAYSLKERAWMHYEKEGGVVLTRMRNDNIRIIKLNEHFGFRRTGITVPSSQVAGLFHEYWFRIVSRKGKS